MKNGFDATKITGLSEEEAVSRLAAEGYNEIPQAKKKSIFVILFEI